MVTRDLRYRMVKSNIIRSQVIINGKVSAKYIHILVPTAKKTHRISVKNILVNRTEYFA
jgi:hypothetical protein